MTGVEGALLRGRALAESLMTSTGTMYSPTGHNVINSDGEEVATFATEYTSPCKVQSAGAGDRIVTVGGVERPVFEGGLHLPVSDRPVEAGWEFHVDTIGPGDDPLTLGKRYRIVPTFTKSKGTARRLDVVEV